jgi:hypothetical protein
VPVAEVVPWVVPGPAAVTSNKADPRVDSDRDNRARHEAGIAGAGTGTGLGSTQWGPAVVLPVVPWAVP